MEHIIYGIIQNLAKNAILNSNDKSYRSFESCSENVLILLPGFWRKNNLSDEITPCAYIKDCVGGSQNNLCFKGHSGALCNSCDSPGYVWGKSYTRASENNCIACDTFGFIAARFILVFLVTQMLVYFAVYTTM
jgi:hypothetical protein